MRRARPWALSAAALISAATFNACLMMPVPAKTRTESAHGPAPFKIKELKNGITTEEEAREKLAPFLVDVDSKNLLWARCTKSTSAILWAAGGPGAATGGGERNWGIHNTFATFSKDGTLEILRDVKDGQLHAALREYMKAGEIETADLEEPVELDVTHRHRSGKVPEATVKMTLKKDEVILDEYFSAKHSFHLKPGQLLELTPAGGLKRDPKPYAGSVLESLRFVDSNGQQHRWSVYVAAVDLPVLLRYFDLRVESSRSRTVAKIK
jgi:hypothetical protein